MGRMSRVLASATPIALVVCFAAVRMAASFTMPLGEGHDGNNLAVWGVGARALVEHGPAASSLGLASQEQPVAYLHHPMLLPWLMAAVWRLTGAGATPARVLVATSSAVAIAAIHVTVRNLGGSRVAAAAATLAMAGSATFVTFGQMVDSWTFGLGPGALLLATLTGRHRSIGWRRATGPVAFVAAASCWLGAGFAVLAALAVVARRRRRMIPGDRALIGGAFGGLGVVLAVIAGLGGVHALGQLLNAGARGLPPGPSPVRRACGSRRTRPCILSARCSSSG